MAITLEIGYFNSFWMKKKADFPSFSEPSSAYWAVGAIDNPTTGGSTSIAYQTGPPIGQPAKNFAEDWYLEESRIRGGYNNTSTDYGVKAYIVEENDTSNRRGNSLIYSGVYNSRTGINNTNQFSVSEDITRSVDPVGGTIQKLFSEDTNLTIFQERKVNIALIDKDAIYTAEGQAMTTSANIVIGQITPVLGNWGIGTNPESFAYYGYRKYFVDRDRHAILRLAGGNIEEISSYGMIDFFRDQLSDISDTGAIIGGYDVYNQNYILSLQTKPMTASSHPEQQGVYKTLTFDERIQGWTGFYTYKPNQVFSLQGQYYTAYGPKIYKHYQAETSLGVAIPRNQFYGVDGTSSVQFIFNPDPNIVKTFQTIAYEGSNGWKVTSLISDETGKDLENGSWINNEDTASIIYSYNEGVYLENNIQYRAGFDRKQNQYVASIRNNTTDPMAGEVVWGSKVMGIKAYYATVTMQTDATTDPGGLKELFAVSSDYRYK
tara:strand:- start:4680 stop:6149 length:1470 start_codon:yes stop_codon:yes gene_type:complete